MKSALATLALLLALVAACGSERAEVREYARDMQQWYEEASSIDGLFVEYDHFAEQYSFEAGLRQFWHGYVHAWPGTVPPEALEDLHTVLMRSFVVEVQAHGEVETRGLAAGEVAREVGWGGYGTLVERDGGSEWVVWDDYTRRWTLRCEQVNESRYWWQITEYDIPYQFVSELTAACDREDLANKLRLEIQRLWKDALHEACGGGFLASRGTAFVDEVFDNCDGADS